VSALLAEIAGRESMLPPDLADMRAKRTGPWSAEALDRDARHLAEFERPLIGVPWHEVKAWMESWGTSNELPRPWSLRL
jgi:hypothetical protein